MASLLTGKERLGELGTVSEFWQWAMSDLLLNTSRGALAEFLVGKALGASETLALPRAGWAAYDIVYRGVGIEVKSTSFVQTWDEKVAKEGELSWGIAPHKRDLDSNATEFARRWAHLYIFCLFSNHDAPSRNVLDLSQWAFYVTTTTHLETQVAFETKNISLKQARAICGAPVGIDELKAKVDGLL